MVNTFFCIKKIAVSHIKEGDVETISSPPLFVHLTRELVYQPKDEIEWGEEAKLPVKVQSLHPWLNYLDGCWINRSALILVQQDKPEAALLRYIHDPKS